MAEVTDLIAWSNIRVDSSFTNYNDSLIGKGRFGPVFRAKFIVSNNKSDNMNLNSSEQEEDVAVKLVTKSLLQNPNVYDSSVEIALAEIKVIREANLKIISDFDCIVKLYDGVRGVLSSHLASTFQLNTTDDCVGIVLRYESGGSLESLLYPDGKKMTNPIELNVTEKLRLLTGIASGLSELHGYGIVHGDIKPANILLSGHTPPHIRLSDFGLSTIRADVDQLTGSTLNQTYHVKGTPVYNAPEKLFNPFSDEETPTISDSTRKTDIYAFAILTWEVLSGNRPFDTVKQETQLSVKVHKGERPPIIKLPSEVGDGVISMISKCWSVERSQRLTAIECACILDRQYQSMSSDQVYDTYLSYSTDDKPFIRHVYNFLLQRQFHVWCDEDDSKRVLEHTKIAAISSCKTMISFVSDSYQNDSHTKLDIQIAADMKKSVLSVLIQKKFIESIGAFDVDLSPVFGGGCSNSNVSSVWVEGSDPSLEAYAKFKVAAKASPLLEKLTEAVNAINSAHPSATITVTNEDEEGGGEGGDTIPPKPVTTTPSKNPSASIATIQSTVSDEVETKEADKEATLAAAPPVITRAPKPPKPTRPLRASSKQLDQRPEEQKSLSTTTKRWEWNENEIAVAFGSTVSTKDTADVALADSTFKTQFVPSKITATSNTSNTSNANTTSTDYDAFPSIPKGNSSVVALTPVTLTTSNNSINNTPILTSARSTTNLDDNYATATTATAIFSSSSVVGTILVESGVDNNNNGSNNEVSATTVPLNAMLHIHASSISTVFDNMGLTDVASVSYQETDINERKPAYVGLEIDLLLYSKLNKLTELTTLLSTHHVTEVIDFPDPFDGSTALIAASAHGHEYVVELLLNRGAKANLTNKKGRSALILASKENHIDTVRLLLSRGADANIVDDSGSTVLEWQCYHGHYDTVKQLLKRRVNIMNVNKEGDSALSAAAKNGHAVVVKLLLERGAAVKTASTLSGKSCHSELAIIWASRNSHMSTVDLLLQGGIDVNATDADGNTALMFAALNNHLEILIQLLQKGAQINAVSKSGITALTQASKNGHIKCLRLLLSRGAYARSHFRVETALIWAAQNNHYDVVDLLIQRGSVVNSVIDSDGRTPIIAASLNGNTDVVRLLIQKGANVNVLSANKASSLIWASRNGHTAVVRLLLSNHAILNKATANGNTALILASWNGHEDIVEVLLSYRKINVSGESSLRSPLSSWKKPDPIEMVDIEACNEKKETALILASRNGHFNIVRMLLDAGADTSAAYIDGRTSLLLAIEFKHFETAKLLMDRGANVNSGTKTGETCILWACQNNMVEAVALFLDRGAKPDCANSFGNTPLYVACTNGSLEIVKLLSAASLNFNITNNIGNTALLGASQHGYIEIVKLLIEKNVNVNIANQQNETAVTFASRLGHRDVMTLLLDAGADGCSALRLACKDGDINQVNLLLSHRTVVEGINKSNNEGSTALILAAEIGDVDIVKALLDKEAKIDLVNDHNGNNALIRASKLGHYGIVEVLLNRGANMDATNKKGKSAIVYAASKDHFQVVELLKSKGAKYNESRCQQS